MNAAAPEGRPGGGSGTYTGCREFFSLARLMIQFSLIQRNPPIQRSRPIPWGRHSGGAKPRERLISSLILFYILCYEFKKMKWEIWINFAQFLFARSTSTAAPIPARTTSPPRGILVEPGLVSGTAVVATDVRVVTSGSKTENLIVAMNPLGS
jgi:hypothetical protein